MSPVLATDVERWAWATRQQLDAFDVAFGPWLDGVRRDPQASLEAEAAKQNVRFTLAAYFALVAAHQLGKALRAAGVADSDADLFRRVKSLRDIHEHWEQHRGSFFGLDRSRARTAAVGYLRMNPDGHPWLISWDGEGAVTLGDLLPLGELRDLLDRL